MPNGVIVRELLPDKEDHSEGVGKASGDEEPYPCGGKLANNGGKNGDGEPAHDNVESGGGPVLAIASHEGFGKDAADGQKPNHSKDTPSQRPSNGDKGEGGVGTCDEEVDGGVVKDLKELLEAMAREAVVEGGGKVKEDHAGSKDDSRDHSPSVFGKKADEDKAGDRGDDSKSVGDRGGEFFSRRITERGSGAGCCGELLHGEKGSL